MSEKEDNVTKDFLAAYIPEGVEEYAPTGTEGDGFSSVAAEHFRKLEAEERQLLGEIANMRFIG